MNPKIDYISTFLMKHKNKWIADVTIGRGDKYMRSYLAVSSASLKRLHQIQMKVKR